MIGSSVVPNSITLAGAGSFNGIKSTSTASVTVKGNKIANITLSGSVGSPVVNCIYMRQGTVDQNIVYNIGALNMSITPEIYGINNATTDVTGNTVTNNMIALKGGNSANPKIFGIYDQSVTNAGKISCNSVSITGSAYSAATNSTYAFYRNGSAALILYNNILYNARATTSGAKHYAVYTTSTLSWSSDYNDMYTISPNLGYWGGSVKSTLSGWKSGTGKDLNSISISPVFLSPTDLHLTAANTGIDNKGTSLNGMTYDFDGAPRSGTTPDIGADEFTSTPAFQAPENEENPATQPELAIYPNPMTDNATLAITLGMESHVSVTIFNIIGEQIQSVEDRIMEAGTTNLEFRAGTLPSGIYFCRMLINEENVIIKRIEVTR